MASQSGVLTKDTPLTINAQNISQGYRKHMVLEELTLQFGAGVTAILGPNGAGKTTLLRTLVTDLLPRRGTITYGQLQVPGRRAVRAVRKTIGFLPQDFDADPAFTPFQLVTYAAWLREADHGTASVNKALDAVGLRDQAHVRIRRLSGGMKQRAAIAATIAGSPPILVFDEPTVGLDPEQRVYFRDVLMQLQHHCVILSTHLIEDVVAAASRVVVIGQGTVAFDGTPRALEKVTPGDDSRTTSAAERGYLATLDQAAR